VDKNSADDIDVREGNQVGINLVLLLKKTISGKVVLPMELRRKVAIL